MVLSGRICNCTVNVKLEDHPLLAVLHCVCNVLVSHFKESDFESGKWMKVA